MKTPENKYFNDEPVNTDEMIHDYSFLLQVLFEQKTMDFELEDYTY